ncbi:MAG: hypothetical protein V7K32_19195 [Nostoc sp.]
MPTYLVLVDFSGIFPELLSISTVNNVSCDGYGGLNNKVFNPPLLSLVTNESRRS